MIVQKNEIIHNGGSMPLREGKIINTDM